MHLFPITFPHAPRTPQAQPALLLYSLTHKYPNPWPSGGGFEIGSFVVMLGCLADKPSAASLGVSGFGIAAHQA